MLAYLALLALLPAIANAVTADEVSFAKIAAYPNIANRPNASGQFDITLTRGAHDLPASSPLSPCTTPIYGACYNFSNADPYKQPFTALSSEFLTITWKQKARWAGLPIQTYLNKTAVSVQAFLCYSTVAATDRGWRGKNKAFPRLSQNCPFGTLVQPFVADAAATYTSVYEFEWGELMPTATMFVNIWVKCEDGTICAFQNTENTYFIQTQVYQSRTPGMIAAASVLSILSWVIFFGFFAFDNYWYRKTGRGFYF